MKTDGLSPTALLLVLLGALSTLAVPLASASSSAETVTGRCDAPYKTLSSDCRDAQYGANFLCVVNDQRAGQPSPCTTGPVNKPMECAIRSGLSCDLLSYKIDYTPTQARFHIKFRGDASPVAPPIAPPRPPSVGGLRLLATGGSGSGDGPKTPHPIRAGETPSPRPRTPPPVPVDPTVAPVTTAPTIPSATRVDTLPPQPPVPISPARPPVDPTVAPVTIAPATPSSTRVDTLPPQPGSGDGPKTPHPIRADVTPSPRPRTPPPAPVDPTVAPVTIAPATPSSTRVDTLPPQSGSGDGPKTPHPIRADVTPSPRPRTPPPAPVDPTVAPVTIAPTTPSSTRVDTLPPQPPVPIAPAPGPVVPIDYNGNNVISSESNEFVDAIGVLRLDHALTELRIVGGASEVGTRGKTVKLSIDPQMLMQSPQVTALWIANCDVGTQLSTGSVLSGMPTGLTDLNLPNTMMRDEPNDLSTLQNLRSLNMNQNYLSTFSSKVSLPNLLMLDLTKNVLTSLEAYLPALETLYLTENPIAALVVSETQFNFLKGRRIKIDKPLTTPPSPVIYVAGPVGDSPPTVVTPLVLDNKDVDLSTAAAVPVGTLVDLQGFPVWHLSDALYDAFKAQQEVISRSPTIIGGMKAQSYQAKAADEARKASTSMTPSGEDSMQHTDGEDLMAGPSVPPGFSVGAATGDSNSNVNANAPASPKNDNRDEANARDLPTIDSKNTTASSGTNHKTLIVSLATVGLIAVVAFALLFVRRQRRQTTKGTENSASGGSTPRAESSQASYQAFDYKKTKSLRDSLGLFGTSLVTIQDADVSSIFSSRRIRAGDLEDVRIIGSSSTSVVWLVKLRGLRPLASKRLIEVASTDQRMAEFVSEIVIAADLDHPSIVHLVGIAWTSRTDLQALFEYMPNGDLQAYLRTTGSDSLSWSSSKLKLAIEIVEALVYTHSFNPPLLHRDVRTRNVLLDEDVNAKLSNFGSARFASEQNTMTTDGVGSSRWLAPEILCGSTDYGAPSDVYAFGVLLCELDTHSMPYEDVQDASGNSLAEAALIERVARGELRPRFSATCPQAVRELANRCLSHDLLARPTAMQAAYELRLLTPNTGLDQ